MSRKEKHINLLEYEQITLREGKNIAIKQSLEKNVVPFY
ncbi:hypothetical protein SAMN06269250_3317 [Spirosoma fluviale]|uniref:Uncharacterized protein n=1 Tax=Spirosoma fluviale TaxID=1597977 RepID=A0A286G4K5_9BACT|nr:hypothetical protein SAMN06269250_3317 [Spirosoma fluviale]